MLQEKRGSQRYGKSRAAQTATIASWAIAAAALFVLILNVVATANALDTVRSDLRALATAHRVQQKRIVTLWCDKYSVGPTGAFCVPYPLTQEFRTYRLQNFDGDLANVLGDFFLEETGSVADVGGSIGLYTESLRKRGVEIDCYDGAENIEEATEGRVRHLDVTDSLASKSLGKHDWVLCLEVAEHVPLQHETTMIRLLAGGARRGVIMSWAKPGQGGAHHVNEKPSEEVKQLLAAEGLQYDDGATTRLQLASSLPQFKTNLMVFRFTPLLRACVGCANRKHAAWS